MDAKTLAELHLALERTLAEFQRVCEELGTPYFAYGGTAIGAVRHAGFIPWDDDVDVCMLRADYERFLEEAPAILSPEFVIENSRVHPDYPSMFTKLGLRGTAFVPSFIERSSYKPKIALDIFPLDRVAPTEAGYRKQLRSAWFWGRMMYLQGTPTPYVPFGGVKRTLVHAVAGAVYWSMRVLHVRPGALQSRWEKAARRHEGASSERYTDFTDVNPKAWEVGVDELFPAKEAPFESLTVKIPAQYDRVLRRGYGDYMELPPPERRKTHSPVLIQFTGTDDTGAA